MSHASTHAAIDELSARWEKEGFVRKGKRQMARVVPTGLHIIRIGGPGSWRTSISVTFGVWIAPFAAREIGAPIPWPAKRFRVPEEKAWHAVANLQEFTGAATMYVAGTSAALIVGAAWGATDRWLQQHSDFATLATRSIEATSDGSIGAWRYFQIAGLCFLELGQPERAIEQMHAERLYFHRPDVADGHPLERVVGWWERSAAWWRDVAGLSAPAFDGTEGPELPAVRPAPPPKPVPRDSIWYESQLGGEWMKTRDLHVAVDRIGKLLGLTTFTTWDEAELIVHGAPSLELERLAQHIELGFRDRSIPERRDQTFDRAALISHGIEPDRALADAIDRFGPVRFRQWASSSSGHWSGSRFYYWWPRAHVDLPADWLEFCDGHRAEQLHERPRVELQVVARSLRLVDPATGAALPFQGDEYCPPKDNTPSWPSDTSVKWVQI